jgi:hypothetical protein
MEKVCKNGKMVVSMKDTGRTVKLMGLDNTFTPMVTYTSATGSTTKHMVKVGIFILMELNTMGNGTKINNKDKEDKNG